VLTILASLGIPSVIASVSIQAPNLMTATISRNIIALREMTSVPVAPLMWVRERTVNTAGATNLNRMLQRSWIAVSAALLVALLLNGVQVFWRKLLADSETQFWTSLGRQFSFVVDELGQVSGVVERDGALDSLTSPRVDTLTAQQILADKRAKFQSQTPTAGSGAALRRMIDGLRIGRPNFDEMTTW